jgi:hypothetical protein
MVAKKTELTSQGPNEMPTLRALDRFGGVGKPAERFEEEATMHVIILAFATILLALWPARIGAQCDQCEGDFNGDGQVTIDELIVAVNNALNSCPAPGPRFVDNGDGTVTDTKTGLQWEKKDSKDLEEPPEPIVCPGPPSCTNPHDADNQYTWSAAGSSPDGSAFTDFLPQLNSGNGFAGHKDWRLPTVVELQSLVDYGQANPAIDPIFSAPCTSTCTVTTCSCTVPDFYWTSTAGVKLPPAEPGSWTIEFFRGVVELFDPTLPHYVRGVRGGS